MAWKSTIFRTPFITENLRGTSAVPPAPKTGPAIIVTQLIENDEIDKPLGLRSPIELAPGDCI